MIPLSAYVTVSAVLFITGLLGVLIRRNFIIVLMAVEIMLNAANINLVAFSYYLESMAGQLVALFVIAIAAGEAAVGLAIIIVVFRGKISTNVRRDESLGNGEEVPQADMTDLLIEAISGRQICTLTLRDKASRVSLAWSGVSGLPASLVMRWAPLLAACALG